MKKLSGWLAVAGLLTVLGAVGGIEAGAHIGKALLIAAAGAALILLGGRLGETAE